MFKGFGWMTENRLTFAEYLERCKAYRHALYLSGDLMRFVQKLIPDGYEGVRARLE